jgi:hypothetical protein
VTAERVHTDRMRQVIRLPEPTMRPEVVARRKAGADILRPYRGAMWARRTTKSSPMLTAPTPS